ncbi:MULTISPECIES: replication initiation factor domain-containing protein [unclassified Enterococcus]|uniref:replication initiation factor domain-containing protein n=1 Tax=unclassified Enterococcus TaxID=2608891 RepID=UPI001552FEA1|nr:XRE family transcriptional regulator [Enterococcus sp. MMGLQ5-2]MBS7584372.1 XRE family transcriptional regulator [Enterococcus sp. MMGLQ5-1]NPD12227.1 XRE family transcriptional regulator [Enterococcus sp. MMGLQ5-1]NPD36799.1 XRE family transcriptional regulator [Enterococcus sp. MMGLQ5-2]
MFLIDSKELKQLRKKLGFNLRDFAEKVNISRPTLSKYERGLILISNEREIQINKALGLSYNTDKALLHVHIDYLKLTFFGGTIKIIMEKVLGIPLINFFSEKTGRHNYQTKHSCGNIVVFTRTDDDSQGILLDLTGQGVAEFSEFLESKGSSLHDFLSKVWNPSWYRGYGYYDRIHSTRLDLAIDEMVDEVNGNYELHDLKCKREAGLVDTKFKIYHEQEKKFQEERKGLTLCFGSRGNGSPLFLRFYEKRYELANKYNMTVEEIVSEYKVWNRFELEIGKELNEAIFQEYIGGKSLDEIAINLLLSRIDVYEEYVDEKGVKRKQYCSDFYNVFGNWKKVKFGSEIEEKTLEKTIRWIETQVAASLKFLYLLWGREQFLSWLFDLLERTELSAQQEKQLNFERMMDKKGVD